MSRGDEIAAERFCCRLDFCTLPGPRSSPCERVQEPSRARASPASIGTAGYHHQEGIAEISPRGTVFSPTEVMFAVGQEGGGEGRMGNHPNTHDGGMTEYTVASHPPHTWPLDCYAAIRKIL